MHAFADENKVEGFRLVVAMVEPGNLTSTRKTVAEMRMKGQRRVHFTKESDSRRRAILSQLARLAVPIAIYDSSRYADQVVARQRALELAFHDQVSAGARRVTVEIDIAQRESDHRILFGAARKYPAEHIEYALLRPEVEPLLWIPDAIAWCEGRGGRWKQQVAPMVTRRIVVP